MSNFRQVIYQGKTIVVSIANMVHTSPRTSLYRPLVVLDQNLVEQTLQRTEEAIKRPGVVPGDKAAQLSRIVLTSMNHTSEENPREQATCSLVNEEGADVGKLHVTASPAEQGPARMQQQAPVPQTATSAAPQWVWDKGTQKYRHWNGSQWIWQ